jgi:hypothetical protein
MDKLPYQKEKTFTPEKKKKGDVQWQSDAVLYHYQCTKG